MTRHHHHGRRGGNVYGCAQRHLTLRFGQGLLIVDINKPMMPNMGMVSGSAFLHKVMGGNDFDIFNPIIG